jgi:hypothetical protein
MSSQPPPTTQPAQPAEIVKVKITSAGISGSTSTEDDVAVLNFHESSISSTKPLYVGNDSVLVSSDNLKVDDKGVVQSQTINTAKMFATDTNSTNYSGTQMNITKVNADSVKVSGKDVITVDGDNFSYDASTQTLKVKNLKVDNIEVSK